jgi:hypothetical protein
MSGHMLPGLGVPRDGHGLVPLEACSDGHFRAGRDGVRLVLTPADRRVEFIVFARGTPPQPRDGYVLHVVAGEHPASATEIREAVTAGETAHPWLNPAVAKTITERGLYQPEWRSFKSP